MITEEALRHDQAELRAALPRARERQRRALQIHSETEAAVFSAGKDVAVIERAIENNELLLAFIAGPAKEAAE